MACGGEVATTFHVPRDRAVEILGGGGERRQTWRLRRGAGTIERAHEQSTWMSFSERVPYRKSLRRGRSQKVTRSKYQRDRRADPRWAAKTVDGTSAGTRFWRGVSEHYITSITSLCRRNLMVLGADFSTTPLSEHHAATPPCGSNTVLEIFFCSDSAFQEGLILHHASYILQVYKLV